MRLSLKGSKLGRVSSIIGPAISAFWQLHYLTLDDLAPNRIICGIGAWWDPLARNVGIERKKPLTAMKETVLILRRLLNMERVTFHGEFVHVDGIELDVVHGRREPRNVPIMIGATGDQMMEMTGEIADGAVLNYCVPPEYNNKALELLANGAKKAGRNFDQIDRPQLVVCSVDLDHDKAIETTKMLLCQYLAQQPHIAKASGVSQEIIDSIQAILGWPATREQINKAKHLVPDELVNRITASGTPEEARSKVNEYRKHGATCPVLYAVKRLALFHYDQDYSDHDVDQLIARGRRRLAEQPAASPPSRCAGRGGGPHPHSVNGLPLER